MELSKDDIHAQCMKVLDDFMAGLNAFDAAAMGRCMHFPHVRLAEGKVTIYPEAGSNPMDLFDRLREKDGWKWSEWGKRDLVQFNQHKAHYQLDYTRYRNDGSVIGVYESLYVMTHNNGRWGILARSSFGP